MSIIEVFDKRYEELKSVDWDFVDSSNDSLASIHPYPAKFIPNIPRELIRILGCNKQDLVMDPFCGSGTTLVEAQRAGYDAVGVDLNPIACLISSVKTQEFPKDALSIAGIVSEEAMKQYREKTIIPDIPNLDHWFKKDIQKAISSLLYCIEQQNDFAVKNVLKLALSSIIVKVSNQESDTRYAAIDNDYTSDDVFDLFLSACKKIYNAKEENKTFTSDVRVINEDVLKVTATEFAKKVGLIITSPPYPNAYEYWLYHKYRMWWLGFDPIQVRTLEIGARPHFQKKNGQTEEDFRTQMSKVFDLFSEVLNYNAHVCFVVGRSIIKGRIIDNADLIQNVALEHNMKCVANIEREIIPTKKSFNLKYGRIKRENILIFRKG